jgi:hypothetical protein
MHEYQNKGHRKWAIHKCMKRKKKDESSERRALNSRMGIV